MKRCRRRACDTKLAEIEELDDTTPEFQEESADPAEAKDSAHRSFRTLVVNWHILFSRTYLVPQLGFTVHDEEREYLVPRSVAVFSQLTLAGDLRWLLRLSRGHHRLPCNITTITTSSDH
jgi:hypothetical protein